MTLKMECLSPYFKPHMEGQIDFRLVKDIPQGLSLQIDEAVMDFLKTSHLPEGVNLYGCYLQTLQTIANITVSFTPGEFWIGTLNGDLVAYILGYVANNFDGKLGYTVSQAWVRKDQRGKPWVKQAWGKVRQRAIDCFCKHFVVISSREKTKAYCRFLGKGFHKYAEILKEEL